MEINYGKYEHTKMFKIMSEVSNPVENPRKFIKELWLKTSKKIIEKNVLSEYMVDILPYEKRERLKRLGEKFKSMGMLHEGILLIDIAHRHRRLDLRKWYDRESFQYYVDRKYNNKECLTC